MDVMQETMRGILDIEWEMFHSVQGIDGPAACQQDRKTFEIMRSSQLQAWNQATAESYLDDLQKAEAAGRNLMTEKYARMMEYSSPCEFRRIAPDVSLLDAEAAAIIERLSDLSVRWMEELAEKYPHVGAQGRPIRNSGDSAHTPSFETYNRGELGTYSVRTLRLLEDHYMQLEADGQSAAQIILQNTVERLGYASLDDAEAAQKARVEKAQAERG
ncbi:MAG: DUF4125 family protein [Thermoleophilia bacterium]|nr:DUF4125 family protein [Thermoleophilia bacterium]